MTMWQGVPLPVLEGFTGFAPPEGDGTYHVACIVEALGEWEARESRNLHPRAPAGSTFDRLLRRAGLDREKFVIWNTVPSRPPNNYLEGSKWEGEAIAAYAPFRQKAFDLYRPSVFVALGNVALKTLTPYGGKGATITQVQGYVCDGPYDGTWVIPALHPSSILQGNHHLSGVIIWALQRAVEIAKSGFTRQTPRYIAHPSLDDALDFERGYSPDHHILSYDIETSETSSLTEEEVDDAQDDISYTITRISFCYSGRDGYAISFPWQQPFTDIASRLLASPGAKRVWNGNFDNPRLAASGSPVRGRNYDVMNLWHFLQPTLPRSLGFVAPFYNWTGEPWKMTSDSAMERYSCADAHSLQLIGDGVDEHLRQRGIRDLAERHVVEVSHVLHRMSQNGLPYSTEEASRFRLELEEKWKVRFDDLQRLVPESLKPSKQKHGYKKVPKDTTGLVWRKFYVLCTDLTTDEEKIIRHVHDVNMFGPFQVSRWCLLEPFLPTSPPQVRALIKFYEHKVGVARKTKKETTDDDTIRKLIKKLRGVVPPKGERGRERWERDQQLLTILTNVRECRQLSKVLGTYVKGWQPGTDGRIHATPGFWGKMFRISWRRPNISATIQDKQEEYVAQGFRKCVRTTAGRVLVESDWKGLEAVLVGWFASDTDYMRLARLGVHDYMGISMAGGSVDLSLPDDDLRAMFKEFRKAHPKLRDDAKHTIHGTNYGMGPRLMADLYEMSEREARRLQDLYFALFPKIRAWQKSVLDRASREAKLTNPFGYSMSFFEVFRWNSRYQRWELGEDAKSAIAFLPRDTGAAMLKEAVLTLSSLADEGILLATNHDAILAEVDEENVERVATRIQQVMESPVKELGGLQIGVDLKIGRSWHEEALHLYSPNLVEHALH